MDTLPVSLRLLRELHELLMRGVRGEVATPGEFRRSQNWIGPPGCTLNEATYVPPPPSALIACLDAWERFLYDDALPPLVHAALAHSQFEAIHPFLDGNGRVGRLLITLLLVNRGVIPAPLLYLSAYFEATRQEYYARLLGVTRRGEWEEWLTYFLRGLPSSLKTPWTGFSVSTTCSPTGSKGWHGVSPGFRKGRLTSSPRIPFGQLEVWLSGWKWCLPQPNEPSTGWRRKV